MRQELNTSQLALTLTLPDLAELKNFVAGPNDIAVKQVHLIARGQGEFCVYLWGAQDVGRSHLLQGACEQATSSGLSAAYFPLKDAHLHKPQDLVGLESLDLICLDDVHLIAGSEWEEAIFHLYNKMRDQNKHLLVSGDKPPARLDIKLPDLKTRLGWGVIYHLNALTDEEKLKALRARASQRGMELADDVGKYILSRATRSMGELHTMLDQLDKASLTHQRKLTIPFVKQVLHL